MLFGEALNAGRYLIAIFQADDKNPAEFAFSSFHLNSPKESVKTF